MSAHDIVARLEFCRQTSPTTWISRCPAHEDRSPSLSIRDVGGGRTLVHCFSGCTAEEVVESVGLVMQDLYPPSSPEYVSPVKHAPQETVDSLVIEIAEHDRAVGKRLSKEDVERYRQALRRNPPKSDVVTEIAYEAGALDL
jgi:hypothetical protein